MVHTIWQLRVGEEHELCSKLVYGGFIRCWSWFCYQTFKIENGGKKFEKADVGNWLAEN